MILRNQMLLIFSMLLYCKLKQETEEAAKVEHVAVLSKAVADTEAADKLIANKAGRKLEWETEEEAKVK